MIQQLVKRIFFVFIGFFLLFIDINLHSHGFASYTLVKGKKDWKSIERIYKKIGDNKTERVISSHYDSFGRCDIRRVRAAGESETNCYFRIRIDWDSANDIVCTPSQGFYVASEKKWLPAYQLQRYDELFAQHNKLVRILDITFIKAKLKVYAIEVNDNHNYFVGKFSILTHNMVIPIAASIGIGTSFGAGATAGGVAGSYFGPITFCGGIIIGGLAGVLINTFLDNKTHKYELNYDIKTIDMYLNSDQESNGQGGRDSQQSSGGPQFREDPDDKNILKRKGAFRAAKRDSNIPNQQHPDDIKHVDMRLAKHEGNHVIKDQTGKVIKTREYTFSNKEGRKVIIQDHGFGHAKGGQGPHFNVRPSENLRTGKVPGTKDHYPFKK